MSLETKDVKKIAAIAFAKIAKAAKEVETKDLSAVIECVEQNLMLVKLIMADPKKKTVKRKVKGSRKRKFQSDESADGHASDLTKTGDA